jgi:PKD repeat protein
LRSLLSLLFLLAWSCLKLQAQNLIVNENFIGTSGKTPPSGWSNNTISGVSGDDEWTFGKHTKYFFSPPFDDKFAMFDSYNGGVSGGTASNSQAETVALQSPTINTNGLSNLFISFDYMELSNGGSANLELSTDGGTNWTTHAAYSTITSIPVSVLYDLSAYIGYANFKFRFKWINPNTTNYQGYFAVDNVKLFSRYSVDATIKGLNPMYDKSCPNSAQDIYIVLKNEGSNSINNIPITINITGATTATINYTYSGTLSSNTEVNVKVGTLNTTSGGTFNFSASVNYTGDANSSNNTFTTSRTSAAIAGNPTAINGSACLHGSRVSIGATKSANDSTFWYDQATGGNNIGQGNPFLTPPLDSTTIFYAQNAQLFNNDAWNYQGPYRFNGIQYTGSFFDVSTLNEVLIDSFWQHFAYTGNYEVSIYYKSGTYSGFETNSTAWTLHEKVSVTSSGYGHMVNVKLTKALNIPAGKIYGFYLLADGLATNKSVTFKSGATANANADLSIASAVVSNSQFAAVSGYSWDGRLFYRKLCLSNRVAVKATIKPGPTGASIIKGSPFTGRFDYGTISEPDLMEINQTNTYELTPPSGYANKDHGNTWKIISFALKTVNGYTVPSPEYTTTMPTSSGNHATFAFKGLVKYLDSTLILTIHFSDLVGNLCDSSVKRYLRVVPTPKVFFKFTSPVCDGTPILFENVSSIHSGNLEYKWYFGDGDSSDYEGVAHLYNKFGNYCVTLVATSVKHKISHDTTLCLVISEKPNANFKVLNACEGKSNSFINQSSISSGNLTYDWDFGDGSAHSNLLNPSNTYPKPGGYKATLTVTSDKKCVSTFSRNANQFVKPKADFSFKGTCSFDTTKFVNYTTIAAGDKFGDNWNFGDGASNNQRNPYHIYTTAGLKTIRYKATSQFGCVDSITKTIDILPAPLASFTNGPACNVSPVVFENTTDVPKGISATYEWDFGDATKGTGFNEQHHYPDLGRYTIQLKAFGNNGCKTSYQSAIRVLLQPEAGFNVNDVCAGQAVIFSNKTKGGGLITYKWKFGDGDTSSLFNPIKNYKTTTAVTYSVSLTASTLGGCKHTFSLPVTISENPKCDFTFESAKTGGYEYIFTPKVLSYPFYQWNFEGGGISNANRPTHKFPMDGKYLVKVYIRNIDGCECIDSGKYVTVGHAGMNKPTYNTSISIYPNPTKGQFSIEVSSMGAHEAFDIRIIEMSGNEVYVNKLKGNTSYEMDISTLATGIYFVEIVNSNGEKALKKLTLVH